MADGYDRFENDNNSGGGSFVMGLLTGTVLGAGLGMLFAPKPGSELRSQLTEQAGNLANTVTSSDQYRRATEAAGDLADRGRDIYGKARDAVSKGADEAQKAVAKSADDAQKYVRDAASNLVSSAAPSHASSSPSSSSYSSESMRGSASEPKIGGSTGSGSGSGPRRS